MGFNIYTETLEASLLPNAERGTDTETAQDIFNQHSSSSGVVLPGTAFHNLCLSLSKAYPQLVALNLPVMMGRAWEFFDENHDGLLSREEFAKRLEDLLRPTTAQAATLRECLSGAIMGPGIAMECGAKKNIAVIGAGVAGLQVANLLTQSGMKVTVFEKANKVGGVWRENYADFGLQVPKELYEFPGFPWPAHQKWELFPPGPQVQEYIEAYTNHFDLMKHVKLETAVLDLQLKGSGQRGWTLTYQKIGASAQKEEDQTDAAQTEVFDFCVICTGMYGSPPHIPKAQGWEKFKGEIMHSCTFTDRKLAAGKKVVVVGGGKSAVDNAVAAAKEGVSSTLLCREAHWPVPRYLANLVPFKWGTYSRFGHSTLHTSHEETGCRGWCHNLCAPLKWLWWRIVELMFRLQFCLSGAQVPTSPIEQDLFTGGQILSYEFSRMNRKGQVGYKLGSIDHMTETGVVLTDGTEIEADMVIYGTGFTKSYDLFDKSVVQPALNVEKDGLYLYRNMIPLRVPDLAFVGSEVSTFNNILTHGLQAAWLRDLLTGALMLPKRGDMEKALEKERAWKRSWMPPSSARSSIWQLHMTKYHDNLCKDMGVPHRRKVWNFPCFCCAEVFAPYSAADYEDIFNFEASLAPPPAGIEMV